MSFMSELFGITVLDVDLEKIDYTEVADELFLVPGDILKKIRNHNECVMREMQPTPDSRLYKILTHDLEVVNFELWRRKQIVVMGEFKKRRSMKELRCLTTIVTLILMTIYPTPRPSNAPQLPLFFDCA
ncbi:uncharacterized protein LOC126748372 isoform X1 [Anthonomus grandis grandis]|uniref:uncharacterized protein LOC126748372 isoform X1 n=1 Tax=Anthonomus grandis grandis TaxID=2921223 RepID=UPI00216574D1|nr:uncharacterized protein LOC126748372 isoform X1 [Anthonomus grandis grandis]